jgi:O-antigen ligase
MSLERLERWFVLTSFFIFSSAFIPLWQYAIGEIGRGESNDTDDVLQAASPIYLILYSIIFVITFLLLCRRQNFWKIFSTSWLVPLLMLDVTLSFIWSDYPDLTLRRSIGFGGTLLFSYYLVARFKGSELIELLARYVAIIIIASLLLYIVWPVAATMGEPHPGAWRGVNGHKNGLGAVCSLGIVTFVYLRRQGIDRGKNLALIALAVMELVLSQAATAIAITAAVVGLSALIHFLRRFSGAFLPLFMLCIVIAIAALLLQWESVLLALGRDATLTGRTDIWPLLIEAASKRPILGYGYGVFWEESSLTAQQIWYIINWHFTHSHNGWIETLLQLGGVGLTIVILLMLSTLGNCLFALQRNSLAHANYFFSLVVYVLLNNLTESGLVRYADMGWVLLVSVSLLMARYMTVVRRKGDHSPVIGGLSSLARPRVSPPHNEGYGFDSPRSA